GEELEIGSFDYLVAHKLRQLQSFANYCYEKPPFVAWPYGTTKQEKKTAWDPKRKGELQTKTLLVNSSGAFGKMTPEKIGEALNISIDKIKVVSKEEIASAIEKGDENVNYILTGKSVNGYVEESMNIY